MRKLLVVSLALAACLVAVGISLASKTPAKSLPCKTVRFEITERVWNAKHTKKITANVYKLVKATVEVDGRKQVELVKEPVYKLERICTAAISQTAVTTVLAAVATPVPTTSTIPVTTSTSLEGTTTTTSSATTTTGPHPTITTLPAPGESATTTALAPVITGYPNTCGPSPAYCYGETVFSAIMKTGSGGRVVPLEAGDVRFVFHAPVTDTDGGRDPYEFKQFALVTTHDGQAACPLQWQSGAALAPAWWQADPSSVQTDGIPACTITGVSLYNGVTATSYPCTYSSQFTGPLTVASAIPTNLVMPCGIAPGLEDGQIVGAALTWQVTAEFTGTGAYAPSHSAEKNLTVGPTANA